MNTRRHLTTLLGLLLATPLAHAEAALPDALDLSLEELMNVVVTSVARKAQTLSQTAAAAYVIQAEDIRRSGATNIPEALRLAPGVQVSAIGNNKWAVSIRGQADRFSNKLLVLVDGRSVYSPLFSGVFWEALDIPMENIERIEVMRGPGASVWGANAVNGVINIITRSAFDTQGGLVTLATGSELRGYGMVRQGWSPSIDTAIQAHAQSQYTGASRFSAGGKAVDDWRSSSLGFKLEHLVERGEVKVQGGLYGSMAGDQILMVSAPPGNLLTRTTQKLDGGHLMGRWQGNVDASHQDSVQAYVEYSHLSHVVLEEKRATVDLEYQQRRLDWEGHDLIWGLGYRGSRDEFTGSSMILVTQSSRDTSLYSAYLQDEISMVPERWRLTLGARLEHNDYTGFEFQPNARLLWTPDPRNSAWLALSHAIRTPTRTERGLSVNAQANPAARPFPTLVQYVNMDFQEERLNALDLGWRHQFTSSASLDLAAFYYRYSDLRGAAQDTPQFPPGYVLIPLLGNNGNSAISHGLEASLDWRPRPEWRLQASYSWLLQNINTAPANVPSDYANTAPAQMLSLRASVDFRQDLHGDAWLRSVSKINLEPTAIPAYTTLDLRLAWNAGKDMEVSLVGQNLLDRAHPEYRGRFIQSTPSEVERGVYLKAEWKH